METLTERYNNYLNAKDDDIMLCEFLSYEEYGILYEDWEDIKSKVQKYRDLEKVGTKVAKYGAGIGAGIAAGAAVGGTAGAVLLGPAIAGAITMILSVYRHWSDKCHARCKGLSVQHQAGSSHGPEYSLCRAKCNKQGATEAISKLKAKKAAALSKEKDKGKKVKIEAKFNKLEQYFTKKMARFDQQIKDHEGSMRGRSGSGY
jgi:hypothetical protein